MRTISRVAIGLALVLVMVAATFPSGGAPEVDASSPMYSSMSFYLNCRSGLAFALPSESGACGSGNYSAVYNGVSQIVDSPQRFVFYLASAQGSIVVTYSVTDETSHNLLARGSGYGSISGGTCANPSVSMPSTLSSSSNLISSGDKLQVFFNATFTGTGTPMFCSGGASASLIGLRTIPVTGSNLPKLTTVLSAGTPKQTVLSGHPGVSVTYTSTVGVSMTAVVIGILKAPNGNVVDVLTTSVMVPQFYFATAFLPLGSYATGTYSITIIAITGSQVPISTSFSGSVSV